MAIQFLHHIDLNDNQLQEARLHNTDTTPSTNDGQIYFDTTTGVDLAKYYTTKGSGSWVTIDPITNASLSGSTLTLTRLQDNLTVDLSSLTPTLRGAGTGLSLNGNDIDANVDGQNSITPNASTNTANRTYKVQVDSSDNLVVNVPWSDTNTNQLTEWTLRDDDNDDVTIDHNKFVKFVAATGTLGTNISGAGTTADPYLVTITSPNDDNYVSSASFSPLTGVLTLQRTGSLGQVTVDISDVNTDNYVDSASLSGTTLTLGRTGILSDLTVDLSSLDEIVNDNSITVQAGTYLSLGSGQDGIFTLNQNSDEIITINHDATTRSDTTSSGSPSAGGTFTAVDSVTTNTQGHVTAINVKTVTLPGDNNTDTLQSIASDSSDNDRFITTVASASGAQTGLSHGTLKYNPSTETLKVTNLIVSGTSTTVDTEVINLADNIITLNSNYTGSTPSENAGIEIERGTLDNVQLNWDEADDDWEFEAYNNESTPVKKKYKIPTSYKATIGGSTSITVDHYLGTRDVIVQLYDSSSYETVYADVIRTNNDTVTVEFAQAPSAGDVTILILSAKGEQ